MSIDRLKQPESSLSHLGCENEERFRSLYSDVSQSQLQLLSPDNSTHPSLLLFVIRKAGLGDCSSLLDCHVFVVYRESRAFELCTMIRKSIVKQTMSPILTKRRTLISKIDPTKENNVRD